MGIGLSAVAAGVLWLAAVGAGEPLALLPAFVVLGAGLGAAAVASTAAGTDAAGPARAGVASGVLNTAAQIGTAIGLAAIVALAGAAGDRWAFLAAAAIALSGVAVARQLSS
jgi:MFS family permease